MNKTIRQIGLIAFGIAFCASILFWSCAKDSVNKAPELKITAPVVNNKYALHQSIKFVCNISDEDSTLISSTIVWTSDKDGVIGRGKTFTNDTLSLNTHKITVTVTDKGGLVGKDSITVTIDQLKTLVTWMCGYFSSKNHADTTTNKYIVDVRLHMVRIMKSKSDYWLYVEQAYADDTLHPYRQRVYHMYMQDGKPQDDIYRINKTIEPLFIGAQRNVAMFDTLSTSNLEMKDGCGVFLHWDNSIKKFVGSTPPDFKSCSTIIPGTSVRYMTSDVTFNEKFMTSWDRGYAGNGSWVMGPDWPYIFDKVYSYPIGN